MKIRAVSGWALRKQGLGRRFSLALAATAAAQWAAPLSGASSPAAIFRGGARRHSHYAAQAKELFALVDQFIQFSSTESGLAVKSTVKRQLTTRTAVESYLEEKFNDDEDSKRMQRDEIVLEEIRPSRPRLRVEALSAGLVEGADRGLLRHQDQDRQHA